MRTRFNRTVKFITQALLGVYCSVGQGADIPGVYSSGVDDSGNPRSYGANETHYPLTSAPPGVGTGTSNTYVLQNNAAWYDPDSQGDNARWIGPPNGNVANYPSGTYVYSLTFDLTCYDDTSAQIQLDWRSDNYSEVWLNNVYASKTYETSDSDASFLTSNPWASVTLSSGFNSGSNTLEFKVDNDTIPPTGNTGPIGLLIRLNSATANPRDYGDAPASYGEAIHNNPGSNLYIGTNTTDTECPFTTKNGEDDDSDNTDDEDGVLFSLIPNAIEAVVTLYNNTGSDAKLCGWLDVPPQGGSPDGTFSSAEGACTTVSSSLTAQTVNFQWTVPTDQAYSTYARFRLTSDLTMDTSRASGTASEGEVEDYPLAVDPTAVTIGQVGLSARRLKDILADLRLDQLDKAALAALLAKWAPGAALDADVDRQHLLQAFEEYLDPDGDGQVATLYWDTLAERGTLGFYVERRIAGTDAPWQRVREDMLPGLINAPAGGQYQLMDPGAVQGTYEYRLIEQEARGGQRIYGPFELALP